MATIQQIADAVTRITLNEWNGNIHDNQKYDIFGKIAGELEKNDHPNSYGYDGTNVLDTVPSQYVKKTLDFYHRQGRTFDHTNPEDIEKVAQFARQGWIWGAHKHAESNPDWLNKENIFGAAKLSKRENIAMGASLSDLEAELVKRGASASDARGYTDLDRQKAKYFIMAHNKMLGDQP